VIGIRQDGVETVIEMSLRPRQGCREVRDLLWKCKDCRRFEPAGHPEDMEATGVCKLATLLSYAKELHIASDI
jgi:hypothetical protein